MPPAAARQAPGNVSSILLCAAFQLAVGRADNGPLPAGRHHSSSAAGGGGNALLSLSLSSSLSDERSKRAVAGDLFAGAEGATRTAAQGRGLYVPLTKRARTDGAVYGVDVSEEGISRRNLGGRGDDAGGVGVEGRGAFFFFLNCQLPVAITVLQLLLWSAHAISHDVPHPLYEI